MSVISNKKIHYVTKLTFRSLCEKFPCQAFSRAAKHYPADMTKSRSGGHAKLPQH